MKQIKKLFRRIFFWFTVLLVIAIFVILFGLIYVFLSGKQVEFFQVVIITLPVCIGSVILGTYEFIEDILKERKRDSLD